MVLQEIARYSNLWSTSISTMKLYCPRNTLDFLDTLSCTSKCVLNFLIYFLHLFDSLCPNFYTYPTIFPVLYLKYINYIHDLCTFFIGHTYTYYITHTHLCVHARARTHTHTERERERGIQKQILSIHI